MGNDKGVARIELRQKGQSKGALPDWLLTEMRGGQEWRPRLPRSRQAVGEVQSLVNAGLVDADLKVHQATGELIIERVRGGQGAGLNKLTRLRRQVAEHASHASEWIEHATLRDLVIAAKIVATPNYARLVWPSRVWNAAFGSHSKQGDVARIAEILGCKIQNRSSTHGIWFYGEGSIICRGRTLDVQGELVVPERWLDGDVHFENVAELGIVENRDLASLAPGFVMALDGHCSPRQRELITQAARQEIPSYVWTDVDGAGISMVRQVRRAHPQVHVVGMSKWPTAWALEPTAEQMNQARDASRIADDLQEIAYYVLKAGWFEQERIFAEATLRNLGWHRVLSNDQWLGDFS